MEPRRSARGTGTVPVVRPLRVGLVGVGHWGQLILRDLTTLGCEVVAVARSPESIARARAGGAISVISDVVQLAEVDGVVVATTIETHAAVTEAVLALDVPVFVEKPLTDDPVTAAGLVASGRDRLFVMDKWRYHAGVLELAHLARAGDLGPIVGLRTTRVSWGNPHRSSDDVWVLAPHDLAIALEVLGHIPAARAASGFVLRGGATGLVAHLGDAPWLVMDVGGASVERRRRVELVCEGGVAWLQDADADFLGVAPAGTIGSDAWERRPIAGELPLLAELRAFAEHLRGGPPPRSAAEEGVVIVERIAELRRLAGIS